MNKLFPWLSLALLMLACIDISAQIHYTITPQNVPAVTTEILDDYHQIIDITPAKLETHLSNIVSPNLYCAACPNTSLNVKSISPATISLKWAPISGSKSYEIRYLNLNSGVDFKVTTTNNQITFSNLAEGAYAFSVVTYSYNSNQLQSSAADVIILETPVLINEGEEGENPPTPVCDCETSSGEYLDLINNTFTWNMLIGEQYLIDLKYASNEFSKFILEAIPPTTNSTLPMQFNLLCTDNLNFYGGTNTFYGPAATEETTLQMFYDNDFYFEFFSDTNQIIGGKIYICQQNNGNNSSRLAPPASQKTMSLKVHPNPTTDQLTIKFSESVISPMQLHAYDQMNRRILSKEIFAVDQYLLDTESWPTGKYFLQLISESGTTTESFIKIN